ncbi:MAG: ABC transporter ATP-binding protein [Thermoplasmata archaeon]|nr:ABC transporter ATP-binding protein [Thermoplasmata archaeon]
MAETQTISNNVVIRSVIMLRVNNLSKQFDGRIAVQNLSFELKPGMVLGLIGPNGAGKTTTMRLILGLLKPTRGTITVDNFDMLDDGSARRAKQRIGFLPENPALYENLTAYKNLYYIAQLYGMNKSEIDGRVGELLEMLGIEKRIEHRVKTYSKGMKQKIAIARAIVHNPTYLLLDEPTASLDPASAKTVREFIKELRSSRRGILLATHNLHEAQELCDEIVVLSTKPLARGKPGELAQTLFSARTAVYANGIPEGLEQVLKERFGKRYLGRKKNKMLFATESPEQENPEIISLLVSQNVKIQFVEKENATLEDVYMKLVNQNGREK